jgi:hypothetical protein
VHHKVIVGLFQIQRQHFVPTQFKVENVADSDVDDSKKTLVASLELALIKYLDSDDGGILDGDVEALVPVWI